MIVKILSAAPGFQGIDYNERKTKDGKSDLLDAKNFGLLNLQEDAKKSDYIGYMKKVADTNTHVKNKQFHAVISCKGHEYSPEQLKDIATQYLQKMGYSENPYLIYYHSDTQNNHVHVVSTRVDKTGKKIDDSFERVRSQSAIQEILRINPASLYKSNLLQVMGYSFSTEAQFKLLLEKKGYSINDSDQKYKLIKFGIVQGEVDRGEVLARIQQSKIDVARINQVKALFYKYKSVHDMNLIWKGDPLPGGLQSKTSGKFASDFSDFIAKDFGIELVFHNKDGKTPYGYSIIDHSANQVVKGSQIMPLVDLLSPITSEGRKIGIDTLVTNSLANKTGFDALKETLKREGLYVNWNGAVRAKGSNEAFYILSIDVLKSLKYNDRLSKASLFKLATDQEQYIIASEFFVKKKDLSLTEKSHSEINYIAQKFKGVLQNSGELKEALIDEGLVILTNGSDTYIMDKANSIIINVDTLLTVQEKQYLDSQLAILMPVIIEEGQDLDKNADSYEEPDPARNSEIEVHREHGITAGDIQQVFGQIKDEKDPAITRKKKRSRR